MVHGEQQDLRLILQADQAAPDQRALFQIKGGLRLHDLQTKHLILGLEVLPQVVLDEREPALRLGGDSLYGLPIDEGEGGAQRFMPDDDPVKCAAQRAAVEGSVQTEADLDVIGSTRRLYLGQEP